MYAEHLPDEAGVAFAVKPGKGPFRGREALLATSDAPRRRLSCLRLEYPEHVVMGKEPVLRGNEVVGYVTSAGFGYSTGESLAYAWLPVEHTEEGTPLDIEYFGERLAARVASEPRWDPEGRRLRV